MSNNSTPASPPPYMPAPLFRSTIETFVDSVVPPVFDRHVLSHLSGADYSAMISGLRFLGLVDSGTGVEPEYGQLVAARRKSDDAYKAALRPIIEKAYKDITGNIDIQTGTLSQLEKAFRDAGVPSGQMLTKTVRFYIKTLADCGVAVSPHMTKPRRPTPTQNRPENGKPARTKKTQSVTKDDDHQNEETRQGFERLPIPGLPNAFIQYPSNLTEANCDLFQAMIVVLRTYVKGRSGGKEKKQ